MKTIKVKQDSIVEFFRTNVIGNEDLKSDDSPHTHRGTSLYHLFKNELPIVKGRFEDGVHIEFKIKSSSLHESKELVNKYLYSVTKYDDVISKMRLKDFSVEVIDCEQG